MSPPEQESRITQLQDENPTLAPPELGPDLTGTVLLDRYRIVSRLGAGGMGTVYLGEHTTIGKKFAIKVLSSEYASRADLVERFLQEARAASMITQQNVVEITDFGDTPDGSVFFVMEFLDGEDLGDLLEQEKRLPWPQVRHVMVQICRALEAAHAAGIIHRDMKPDNCFRIKRGKDPNFIKVLDFGIAKIQSGEHSGKGLTQTGMIFGTPEYMSPEQAQGAKIDTRVDIYAVGVIMYQLLCGRVPFEGETFMSVLTKHMFEVPEAPSEHAPDAQIPPEAEAIVLKAMQKDPAYRFQTMAEMIEAIEAVGTGAEAVEVVAEAIARPEAGPTSFRGGTGSVAVLGAQAEESRSNRMGLWLGLTGLALAGLALAVVAAGYMVFGPQSQADEGPDDAVAQQQPPPAPAVVAEPPPEPPPEPEPIPAGTPVVSLHFDTNVPVKILDARDRAIYGSSDDEGGVELPLSDDAVALILSAEGYDDLEIEVVPNRERKHYQYELEETGSKKTRRSRPRASSSGESKPKSEPEPEPDKPPASGPRLPTKGQHDGDLKNPFAK